MGGLEQQDHNFGGYVQDNPGKTEVTNVVSCRWNLCFWYGSEETLPAQQHPKSNPEGLQVGIVPGQVLGEMTRQEQGFHLGHSLSNALEVIVQVIVVPDAGPTTQRCNNGAKHLGRVALS